MKIISQFFSIFKERKPKMMDKSVITSNLSIDIASLISPTESYKYNNVTCPQQTFSRNETKESNDITLKSQFKLSSKIDSSIASRTISKSKKIKHPRNSTRTSDICRINSLVQSYPVNNLGLNQITHNNQNYYSYVIYLPETDIIIAHYITIFKLKLDYLTKYDFENWCLNIGHTETAKRYSYFLNVYNQLKNQHFKSCHIINKIMSKRNVYLKMSDSFGDTDSNRYRLRALIVIGTRKCYVQNVVDCYSFSLCGKIPFVIKTDNDYLKLIKNPKESITDEFDKITHADILNSNSTLFKTKNISPSQKKKIVENQKKLIQVLNVPPNSFEDINDEDNISQDTEFYTNKVFYNDECYNLISVIQNDGYAYILSRKVACKDLDLAGKSSEIAVNENQSNIIDDSFYSLKEILKNELIDSSNRNIYGISLKSIPYGQIYVVQCLINHKLDLVVKQLHHTLLKHLICGKIVSKEYKFINNNCQQFQFNIHLHGNERHVLNCTNELRLTGLAKRFHLIYPTNTKICENYY